MDPNSPWVGALACSTLLLKIGWDWLTLTSWCLDRRSRYCLEMQAGAVLSPCQVLIQVSLRCHHSPPSFLLVQPQRNVLAELSGPFHHLNSICPKPLPPFSESSPSHFSYSAHSNNNSRHAMSPPSSLPSNNRIITWPSTICQALWLALRHTNKQKRTRFPSSWNPWSTGGRRISIK